MTTDTINHDVSVQHDERYLLGDLDEREIENLERGLLEKPARLEQLEAAETELIDRYVRGELPSGDRNRFERRLLPSARIRERVKTARSLRRLAERTNGDRTPESAETGSASVVPWSRRTTNGNGRGGSPVSSRLAWAACLVVLLATGFLSLLNLRLQDRLDRTQMAHREAVEKALSAEERAEEMAAAAGQAEAREAELDRLQAELTDRESRIATLEARVEETASTRESDARGEPEEAGTVERTTLFLALATRGSAPEEIQLPLEGDELFLQLGLDRKQPEGELTVTVRRSQNESGWIEIWEDTGIEPVFSGLEGMAPARLPEEILFPGVYRVEVTESSNGEPKTIGSYTFVARS